MVIPMKKIIIILFIISSIYLINNKDEVIIPNNSIRFRIIANSNSIEDQNLKNTIKEDLINNILPTLDYNDIDNSINKSIPLLKDNLNKYNTTYDISYGYNYFPKKTYKGITYPSGNYKSLVITLNKGLGNNFFCILYPPLCLINDDNTSDIEYKSLIIDTINNYTHKTSKK